MLPITAPISRLRLTNSSRAAKATTATPSAAPTSPATGAENLDRPKGWSCQQATATTVMKTRRMKNRSIRTSSTGKRRSRYKQGITDPAVPWYGAAPTALRRSLVIINKRFAHESASVYIRLEKLYASNWLATKLIPGPALLLTPATVSRHLR